MAIVLSFVVSFLVLRLALTLAAPHSNLSIKDGTVSDCNFPTSPQVSCSNGIVTFDTGRGNISGTLTSAGAMRFTIKYATAQRFEPPQVIQDPYVLPLIFCFLFNLL